jgi:hypothetical protein
LQRLDAARRRQRDWQAPRQNALREPAEHDRKIAKPSTNGMYVMSIAHTWPGRVVSRPRSSTGGQMARPGRRLRRPGPAVQGFDPQPPHRRPHATLADLASHGSQETLQGPRGCERKPGVQPGDPPHG